MRMRTLLTAIAASSLLVSPALANPASPLSLATSVKASTSAKKSNKLSGEALGAVVGILILAVPVVGAIESDDDSDSN